MPYFVLTCTDHEDTLEKRLAIRPRHVERLQKLDDEGRLIQEEPFLKEGIYAKIEVKPFNKAFPKG